jgi:hypothetical protein
MSEATWKSRIVGYDLVAPDQLLAHPSNFRAHGAAQRDALRGSLNDLGWIAPVLVSRNSGHVIDGHARVEEALTKGCETVPVAYVDLTEAEEREALLVLDPISAMAETSREQLDALLHEVHTAEPGLQSMLADLAKNAGLYKPPTTEPDTQPEEPKDRLQVACPECGREFVPFEFQVLSKRVRTSN